MINELIVVIGAYGSGKSEYSINLADDIKNKGQQVSLVDLDVVNPYFRSRDVREMFASRGIEVIAPEGEYMHADLPMISPRIRSAILDTDKTVILDVGGDPAGCRALVRFITVIKSRGYSLHFVINTKRPFTSDKNEILGMLDSLESMSQLQVSHLICNTNLMQETTLPMVKNGIDIISSVAEEKNIEFEEFLVLENTSDKFPEILRGKKKRVLTYFLNKPWERVNSRGI